MLTFGSNTNFSVFKEKLGIACLEKYGNLERIIEDSTYWEPPQISPAKYKTDDNDMKPILALDLSAAVKDRMSQISRMERGRPKLYGYIHSKISPESEQEMKKHRNYASFSKEVDPLELWKAMSERHLCANLEDATRKQTAMRRSRGIFTNDLMLERIRGRDGNITLPATNKQILKGRTVGTAVNSNCYLCRKYLSREEAVVYKQTC